MERKIPSPKGNSWRQETIRHIITNPTYAGRIRHYEDSYEARHEPIISEEFFDKVQRELYRRAANSVRQYNPSLLGGLIYCGECGSRMRYKSVWQNRPKTPRKVSQYFVCYAQEKVKHMARAPHCDCGYKRAADIERQVLERLFQFSADEKEIRAAVEGELAGSESETGDIQKQIERSRRELGQVSASLERWYQAFEKGALDADELTDRVRELKDKKGRLEGHILNLQGQVEHEKQRGHQAENIISIMRDFPRVWEEATEDERKKLLNKLVGYVKVYRTGRAEVKLNI